MRGAFLLEAMRREQQGVKQEVDSTFQLYPSGGLSIDTFKLFAAFEWHAIRAYFFRIPPLQIAVSFVGGRVNVALYFRVSTDERTIDPQSDDLSAEVNCAESSSFER